MKLMSLRFLISLAVFTLSCTACGFQLRDNAELPPQMAKTQMVVNDEYSMLARRVRTMLEQSGVRFVGGAEASAILEIPVNNVVTDVLTIGDNARVREYRISHTVRFRLTDAEGKVTIKLLYFIDLARVSGKDEEEVDVPESVPNVETLLNWMRKRGERWQEPFEANRLQVTGNKQFSEPYTLIEHGDEVAFVPRPK